MAKDNDAKKTEYRGYLKKMMEIRAFEDKVFELLARDVLKGASHVYAGQEAVAVGATVSVALGVTDGVPVSVAVCVAVAVGGMV